MSRVALKSSGPDRLIPAASHERKATRQVTTCSVSIGSSPYLFEPGSALLE